MAPDRPLTREWGRAGGRPLLFWPGLSPFGELQLVEIGAPPIVDEPDAYLPTRLAEHALTIADDYGFGRFVFMGHSWGGSIGVHLAVDHPERVALLVLLDAGYGDVEPTHSRDDLVAHFEAAEAELSFDTASFDRWDDVFAWAAGRVREWRPALEPRYRAGMVERDGKLVPRAPARVAAWALHGVASQPPSSTWERLRVPVLLLYANESARDLSRSAGRCRRRGS